jgi:hypothetical protein
MSKSKRASALTPQMVFNYLTFREVALLEPEAAREYKDMQRYLYLNPRENHLDIVELEANFRQLAHELEASGRLSPTVMREGIAENAYAMFERGTYIEGQNWDNVVENYLATLKPKNVEFIVRDEELVIV